MRHIVAALGALALAIPAARAQTAAPDHAPAGAVALPLYGKDTPGSPSDEIETLFMGREKTLRNITYPTLTPVLPAPGKANGTAVIIAPGGGFMMLSMQNEGWRVAQALADRGIAAFVLKYRLNHTDPDEKVWMRDVIKLFAPRTGGGASAPDVKDPAATEDALAALRMVRARAAEWHVDPTRVGMIGFSAGAITTMDVVTRAPTEDPLRARPDFIGYIYGPMRAIPVPANAPPMFAALAMDDSLFGHGEFSIISAWDAAKKPVELHVYESGGHGFGMGKPGTTSTLMMTEFLAWMEARGLLQAKAKP